MHIREILTDTWHHWASQSLSEFGETRIAEMPNIKMHRKHNMLCFILIQKPFSENTIQRSVLVNDKRTLKTWVSVCLFMIVIKGSHVGNAERWRCGGGLWLHLSVRYTSREASGCSELVPSCGEAIENWRRQFFEFSPGFTMVYLKNGNPRKGKVKDVCSILMNLCHCLPVTSYDSRFYNNMAPCCQHRP